MPAALRRCARRHAGHDGDDIFATLPARASADAPGHRRRHDAGAGICSSFPAYRRLVPSRARRANFSAKRRALAVLFAVAMPSAHDTRYHRRRWPFITPAKKCCRARFRRGREMVATAFVGTSHRRCWHAKNARDCHDDSEFLSNTAWPLPLAFAPTSRRCARFRCRMPVARCLHGDGGGWAGA